MDNGKAFRSNYFVETDLSKTGLGGLFHNLDIQPMFAWPYHGQSKTVERFFSTFSEMEKWVPSYTGTSIASKPPRLNRGEVAHRKVYDMHGGAITLEQAHQAIALWVDDYINRPQKGQLKGKCPAEVFIDGRGPGLTQTQLEELRVLMLHKENRTIHKNGITFRSQNYYSRELYSLREKVNIRYDEQSRESIEVYSLAGEFICTAKQVEKVHPAANYLGESQHQKQLREQIAFKREQEKDASRIVRAHLNEVVVPENKARIDAITAKKELEQNKVLPLHTPTITAKEKAEFDKAIAEHKQRKELESRRGYTPAEEVRDILSELDKYEYLFGLSVRDGVELRQADVEFMQDYENSKEWPAVAPRYEQLTRFYNRKMKTERL